MKKQLLFERDAREKLYKGVETLTRAVATTLGPRGRNIGIRNRYPQGLEDDDSVVHDGVTVAKAIKLTDEAEDFGASLVRQAAERQVDQVGDGTTVVTILAQAILKEALKQIAAGVNPMSLRRGLEKEVDQLCVDLKALAKPVKTLAEKIQVATIAAEDAELGKMVGETLHKIGTEGVITVEESKSSETVIEHQEGMQFGKGYVSPYFVTNASRMEATVENPYILITDQNVSNILALAPFFEQFGKVSTNLVIIAPEVADTALATLIVNKAQGRANLLAVRAPLFGDKQKEFLDDIAVLTGGRVISSDAAMRFENIKLEYLGRAGRITATKDATLIVDGKGEKALIKDRIESIRAQLERQEGSAYEQEKLKERIAKLGSGVAVIKVGGHTEVEMKERKERAIDAVSSTKAAIEDGIVPGGETVFLRLATLNLILNEAFKQPFYRLVENAGEEPGELYAIWKAQPTGFGFDVVNAQWTDMFKAGIIDPVQVPINALRNALSVAIQIMTVDALIVPENEVKEEK